MSNSSRSGTPNPPTPPAPVRELMRNMLSADDATRDMVQTVVGEADGQPFDSYRQARNATSATLVANIWRKTDNACSLKYGYFFDHRCKSNGLIT